MKGGGGGGWVWAGDGGCGGGGVGGLEVVKGRGHLVPGHPSKLSPRSVQPLFGGGGLDEVKGWRGGLDEVKGEVWAGRCEHHHHCHHPPPLIVVIPFPLPPGWAPRAPDPLPPFGLTPLNPPPAGPLEPLILLLPPRAGPLESLILLSPGGLETSKALRGVGSKPLSSSGGWAGDL